MKTGTFCILFILCALLACTIPTVLAAEEETKDIAIQLYNRGDQLVSAGDYETGIILLDQALAMNTTQFVQSGARTYALLDKSKAQIELGNLTGALATIDQALALEETDKLWNNRGYVLFRLGRYEEAVTSYNTAIKITPDYSVALINKGDALMKLKQYPEAITAYNTAFVSDTQENALSFLQQGITWKDLGDAYVATGQYKNAVNAYENSLKNRPGNNETISALINARQQADFQTISMVLIVIVVLCAGAAAAYFIIRKRSGEPEKKNKSEKKKKKN